MLVGAGALGATDEVIAVAERLGAGIAKALARQGGSSGRPAFLHGLHRPARHEGELGPDAGLRHPAHGGLGLPLRGVSAARSARPAGCRSTSRQGCWACATPWRSTSSATRPPPCAPSCRSRGEDGSLLARHHRRQRRRLLGRGPQHGHGRGRPDQPATGRATSSPSACPIAPSSRPTAAPPPSGTRAISASGAA